MDIKQKIKSKGYTISQIADKLGIKQGSLSQSLASDIRLSTLEKIASAMNISVSELLADEQGASILCPHCKKQIKITIKVD